MNTKHIHGRPATAGGTILRRVIKREDEYVCGICRQGYDVPEEANDCLRDCWDDVLAHTLVVYVRRGIRTIARCRLCKRDHENVESAAACAQECKVRLSLVPYSDDDTGGAFTKRFKRRQPVRLAVVPMKTITKVEEEDEEVETVATISPEPAAATPTKTAEEAPPAPAPATAASAAEPAAAAPAKVKKDHTKKFFRDGARYVCVVCNEKFFTKAEVEKCWDAHP